MAIINEKYPCSAGIYKLTCIENGKIYIGKSVNLFNRLGDHRRCSNRGIGKCYFENALVKYGWTSFEVEILELIPDFDKSNPNHRELILNKETNYIEMYNSNDVNVGYNLCKRSNDRTGIPCSEETKKKMSQAALGKPKSKEAVEKMRKSKTGKSRKAHSSESIERMRQSKTGKKRKPFSEETKRKMSKSKLGNTNSQKK